VDAALAPSCRWAAGLMLLAASAASSVLVVQGQPAWLHVSLAPRHSCYFAAELRRVAACASLQLVQCTPAWWLAAKLSTIWFMSCLREQQGIYKMAFKRKGG
jgi:hypothetical protein